MDIPQLFLGILHLSGFLSASRIVWAGAFMAIYLACTLIWLKQLRTGMKKNFPSDLNFKGNNYWGWKAASISKIALLLMIALKKCSGKALFACCLGILSASSDCNLCSLRLENWLRTDWYPVPCKAVALFIDSEGNASRNFQKPKSWRLLSQELC